MAYNDFKNISDTRLRDMLTRETNPQSRMNILSESERRNEQREIATRKANELKEETEARRHQEVQKQLTELKKPHRPSFWLLVASVTLAFMAAVAAMLSLPQVQKAVFGNLQSQEKTEQLQPSGHKSPAPKAALPKK